MTPTASRRADTHTGTRSQTETTSLRGFDDVKVPATRRAAARIVSATRGAVSSLSGAGRWLVQTVTSVGWFVIAAAVTGLWCGLAFNWLEMLVVGIASVVLVAVSALFLIGGRAYAVDIVLDSGRVVAGSAAGAQLSVRSEKRGIVLPARIEIPLGGGLAEVDVPLLAPGGHSNRRLELPTSSRGIVDVGPVRAVRGDPIGLVRRPINYTAARRLWVHPKTVTLPNIAIGSIRDLDGLPSATIVDSDVSFHAIREYQSGDAQRNVHWKSTAKTGKLMVRQFEESRRSSQAIIMSLAEADYASGDEFELAVSAVASIALQGIRFGRETLVSVSPLVPEFQSAPARKLTTLPTTSRSAMLDATCGLAMNRRAASLVQTAELTGLLSEGMSVAFLVTGSACTLPALQAAALRLPLGVRTSIVVCDPLLPPRLNRIGGLDIYGIAVIDDLLQLARRRSP